MALRADEHARDLVAAGEHYAEFIERLDRSQVTQNLRDRIDVLARRINAASEKNVYGFEALS